MPRSHTSPYDSYMASVPPLTTALPNVAADPQALRVVLFGMPDAGKSSLLGALLQAAHTQDRILQGRLIDLTNGLAELWRRVYEDRQRETREEIVAYPMFFEPYAGDPNATPHLPVMIYDCDGRVANDLLSQRQALTPAAGDGSLAKAILSADAIILAVDASAADEQVETDFREFARFLRVLELQRCRQMAVGDFPIFLALTKCDRMVREAVGRVEWDKRIAERQRQVTERFARYLEANPGNPDTPLSFGSVQMQVVPTAVKRPALTDSPAQPRTPFGVGELFRDCLRAAYFFHQREMTADRRLKRVVTSAGGLLAAAALAAFLLIRSGGPVEKPAGFADKVAQYESRDKPLPDRLANDALQRRNNELNELRENPGFDQLPENLKSFVAGRLEELHAYLRLREQLVQIPTAEKARTVKELDGIKGKLENLAAVPAPYQKEWENKPPPAVIERSRRIVECLALRTAVDQLKTFFTTLTNRANEQLFAAEFSPEWEDRVNSIFDEETKAPIDRTSRAYDFEETASAQKEWLSVRRKLMDVRDMAAALGLTRDTPGAEALLLIPTLPADSSLNAFSAEPSTS